MLKQLNKQEYLSLVKRFKEVSYPAPLIVKAEPDVVFTYKVHVIREFNHTEVVTEDVSGKSGNSFISNLLKQFNIEDIFYTSFEKEYSDYNDKVEMAFDLFFSKLSSEEKAVIIEYVDENSDPWDWASYNGFFKHEEERKQKELNDAKKVVKAAGFKVVKRPKIKIPYTELFS